MRQKIRFALILISFLLFPITIFYFSPVIIIEGATKGIFVGSAAVFSLMFLVSLLIGRAFCGWLCPAGGLQECCFTVSNKKAKGGKYDWIKYFIWAPWISAIIILAIGAGGFKEINLFYHIDYGISVSNIYAYIIYYFFVGLIVLLALAAGKRAFCHYVCWMAPFMVIGKKIRNLFGLPTLHLTSDSGNCNQCKLCVKSCPMSLNVTEMVGTKNMENSECILCGVCVDNCPNGSIKYAFFNSGRTVDNKKGKHSA